MADNDRPQWVEPEDWAEWSEEIRSAILEGERATGGWHNNPPQPDGMVEITSMETAQLWAMQNESNLRHERAKLDNESAAADREAVGCARSVADLAKRRAELDDITPVLVGVAGLMALLVFVLGPILLAVFGGG